MNKQRGGAFLVSGWVALLALTVAAISGGMYLKQRNVTPLIATVTQLHDEAKPEVSTPSFATEDAAAVAASKITYWISHYYEAGGVILKKPDGTYAIGRPHTDFSGDYVSVDDKQKHYPFPIVGSYHSHPCNSMSHEPGVFSPMDLRSSAAEGVPSYVVNFCTGDVSKYDPAKDRITPKQGTDDGWVGNKVGAIEVDGAVLDQHAVYAAP